MFEAAEGHFDLEGILPIGGHTYVVGTAWAWVNLSWIQVFPYTEFREGVTGGLVMPFEEHIRRKEAAMSRKEYIRQNTCEPVERRHWIGATQQLGGGMSVKNVLPW